MNEDPDKVVVYSNHLENMVFDCKDLVHWMALQDLKLYQALAARAASTIR